METRTFGKFEVSTDGRTVWVNGPEGCYARLTQTMVEYTLPQGEFYFAKLTKLKDWEDFKKNTIKWYGVEIPEDWKPTWLKVHG